MWAPGKTAVCTAAAIDDVVAGAAGDGIVASAGEDRVGAGAGVDDDVGTRGADDELAVVERRGQDRARAEIIRIEIDRVEPGAEVGEGVAVNVDVAQPIDGRGVGRRAVGEALERDAAVGDGDVVEGVAGHRDVGGAVGAPGILDHQAAVVVIIGGDRVVDVRKVLSVTVACFAPLSAKPWPSKTLPSISADLIR